MTESREIKCRDQSTVRTETSQFEIKGNKDGLDMLKITTSTDGFRERTEHLDKFFSAHHSMVFYFRCSVY